VILGFRSDCRWLPGFNMSIMDLIEHAGAPA
jgi:hypothetical protein